MLRSSHGPVDVMPMAMNRVDMEVSLCYDCDHHRGAWIGAGTSD